MRFHFLRLIAAGIFTAAALLPTAQAQELDIFARFFPSTAVTGDSVTFSWDGSVNAFRCSVSGVPGLTTREVFGDFTFTATQSLTATVSCGGAINGERVIGTETANLTVLDSSTPPTVSASFSPTAIIIGQSTTLSWSSTNATSCTGSSGVSVSGTSGSRTISPSNTTTVTVTCTGPGGSASDSASVIVDTNPPPPPPLVSAFFSPSFIPSGGFSTLFWFSSNSFFCSGFGFAGGPSGSAFLGPYFVSTFEQVFCEGPGGFGAAFAFIDVGFGPEDERKAATSELQQQALTELGLAADTPIQIYDHDFNADEQMDRLIFLPESQQVVVQFMDNNGQYRMVKAAEYVERLEQIQNIQVQIDLNDNYTVKLVIAK